jgi:hypothetical protein
MSVPILAVPAGMTPPPAVPIIDIVFWAVPVLTTAPMATVPSWQQRHSREDPSGWIAGLVGLRSVGLE